MSSSTNPDIITNWMVVERKDARSLSRFGPYSNSEMNREHEASVFYSQFVNNYSMPEIEAFGTASRFESADTIKTAFKRLLETGSQQTIKLWQGTNGVWEEWGLIKVERGSRPETAEAMNRLIAGEDPDSQGPPIEPLGKNLHLYTVSRRKWIKTAWDIFWDADKESGRYSENELKDRKTSAEAHREFYARFQSPANVDAIDVETFKDRESAVAYARSFTGDTAWLPRGKDMVRSLGETDDQFMCNYPNKEPDADKYPWVSVVIHHSLISRDGRAEWLAI